MNLLTVDYHRSPMFNIILEKVIRSAKIDPEVYRNKQKCLWLEVCGRFFAVMSAKHFKIKLQDNYESPNSHHSKVSLT